MVRVINTTASALALLLLFLGLQPGGYVSTARASTQDEIKSTHLIPCAPKGGLTDSDRKKIARFLAANADSFPEAPAALAGLLSSTGMWSDMLDEYARPVPRRLAQSISAPTEGTLRLVFDGSLLVVNRETMRVVDRVGPAR